MTQRRVRPYEKKGTFIERFPVLCKESPRKTKASKVIQVCQDFLGKDLEKLVCLDIGSSNCTMSRVFASHFKQVVALDTDWVALKDAKENKKDENLFLVCGDATLLPIKDESVDVVICNQVYEHVENQLELVKEIHRVLKDDGFCYFGAGSKYVLIEGHYFLPFLSWLPLPLANLYLRLLGRKVKYDVKLLSYFKLRKLLKDFLIHDYTIKVIRNPKKFNATDIVKPNSSFTKLNSKLLEFLEPLIPVYIWVLTKRNTRLEKD
jgi:SAM-dependent methyltransferase